MASMANSSRSRTKKNSLGRPLRRDSSNADAAISSEEAIKAGEQIAMAAFASGLKLAAAFGTVAAKTAGLALASLASGADKFSELVRDEARRSYSAKLDGHASLPAKHTRVRRASPKKKTR